MTNKVHNLYKQAQECFEKGYTHEAVLLMKKVVALDPGEPYYQYFYAAMLYEDGCINASKKQVKHILEKILHQKLNSAGSDIDFLFGLAYLCGDDDPQTALKLYEQAVMIAPENPHTHYNYGLQLSQMGMHDDALKHLVYAYQQEPDNIHTLVVFGRAYFKQGDFKTAQACMNKALILDPTDPETLLNLSLCYINTNNLSEAQNTLQSYLSLYPDDPLAHARLGVAFALMNDETQARYYQNKAYKLNYEQDRDVSDLIVEIDDILENGGDTTDHEKLYILLMLSLYSHKTTTI